MPHTLCQLRHPVLVGSRVFCRLSVSCSAATSLTLSLTLTGERTGPRKIQLGKVAITSRAPHPLLSYQGQLLAAVGAAPPGAAISPLMLWEPLGQRALEASSPPQGRSSTVFEKMSKFLPKQLMRKLIPEVSM